MKKRWSQPRSQPRRNRAEIGRWMLAQEPVLKVGQIAADTGVQYSNVSNTLADRRHDRQVLWYLVDKGCPVKFLALPADMEETIRRAA